MHGCYIFENKDSLFSNSSFNISELFSPTILDADQFPDQYLQSLKPGKSKEQLQLQGKKKNLNKKYNACRDLKQNLVSILQTPFIRARAPTLGGPIEIVRIILI